MFFTHYSTFNRDILVLFFFGSKKDSFDFNSLLNIDIYIAHFIFLTYITRVYLSNVPRVIMLLFIIPSALVFSRDFLVSSAHLGMAFDYFIRYNMVLYYHRV